MSEVTPIPDPLDELELLVVVDNETDTLSSIEADIPQLPELAGLLSRIPPSRDFNGTPGVCTFDQLCVACHGFSVLLTGRRGDTTSRVLFDVGPYSDVWLDNAERLAIDLSTIERLFLSHWHADHSGGFPGVIEAITNARRAAGLPDLIVDLHPDRPDQRGVLGPTGVIGLLPPEPTFDEITAAGGVIELHDEPHVVGDIFYGSGLIERVTAYETGLAGHHTFVGDDAYEDPLILDERFFAANVAGRGITVLSACSHAGVVNACLGAMAAFPGAPMDVVLGGYHLAGKAMEERISDTIKDLRALINPAVVAPGHCTGWRAKAALIDEFAPGQYGPSVVGTRYVLSA